MLFLLIVSKDLFLIITQFLRQKRGSFIVSLAMLQDDDSENR